MRIKTWLLTVPTINILKGNEQAVVVAVITLLLLHRAVFHRFEAIYSKFHRVVERFLTTSASVVIVP